MSKRGRRNDEPKNDPRFLSRSELPPGSWQEKAHDYGSRFYGPPSNNLETKLRDEKLQASRVGKTVILSYSDGRIVRAKNFATSAEAKTVTREAFEPRVNAEAPQAMSIADVPDVAARPLGHLVIVQSIAA